MAWFRNHWTLFSMLVLVVSAVWIVVSAPLDGQTTGGLAPAPLEGFLAPDFSLPGTDGKNVRLQDFRGQPVLVNLWASWCGPCKAEMPAMQRVYEQYAPQGFVVLAINTTNQDEEAEALTFAQNLGLTFPIVWDREGSTGQAYQARALPTSFFIGRDGVIRRVVIGGPMSEAFLRTEVERLLAEEPE